MRKIFVAALVAVVGCGSGTEPEVSLQGAFLDGPIEITLQHGEDGVVAGGIRVSFTAVLEDSRCPATVVCIWEGNAKVEVGIGVGTGSMHTLRLNTSLEPNSAVWNDIRVTLLEVAPSPDPHSIPADDYAVTLRLESS